MTRSEFNKLTPSTRVKFSNGTDEVCVIVTSKVPLVSILRNDDGTFNRYFTVSDFESNLDPNIFGLKDDFFQNMLDTYDAEIVTFPVTE